MSEKLYVRNFGPIREAELDLKQAMVFIGPQASGKSTLARLVTIMRDWQFIADSQEHGFGDSIFRDYQIASFFKENTFIHFECEEYTVLYENGSLSFPKKEEYLTSKKNLEENPESNLRTLETLDKIPEILKEAKKQVTEENVEIVKALLKQLERKNYAGISSLKVHSLYIPAERSFISVVAGSFMTLQERKVSIPQPILRFGAAFEEARNATPSLKLDLISAEYKYENQEDRIYFQKDSYLKLTESASGFQTLVPMALVIEHFHNYDRLHDLPIRFIIEEPELNLYPTTQRQLINYLVEKCTYVHPQSGLANQLLITTHSPYVLTSLNVLIAAHEIARLYPQEENTIEEIAPKASWLNPECFGAYYVSEGTVRPIMQDEESLKLIQESQLDEVSEDILDDFDALMEIFVARRKKETSTIP